MASLMLSSLAPGQQIFVDANIFIYHFTGLSPMCRQFLARCEQGEVRGVTSTLVLAEVTHRLMLLEASSHGVGTSRSLVKELSKHPSRVTELTRYTAQVEQIPLMGIKILPTTVAHVLEAGQLRATFGMMTNDSLIVAAMREAGTRLIASADAGFDHVAGVQRLGPSDLGK